MPDNNVPISLIIGYVPELEVTNFRKKLESLGFKEHKSSVGMVMAKAKDCFNVEFYLGEVLVSQCFVELDGNIGFGMIIGHSTDKAFVLACYDVIEDSDDLSLKKLMQEWLSNKSKYYIETTEREKDLLKSTKVNFGLMVEG